MKRVLIIGGGFGGCTAVHLFSKKQGWEVTLSEPSPNGLGGGVRTRFKSGHPYTYGPRHFLTHNEKVYSYLSSHLSMRLCKEHQFLSFVDNDSQFYNYPIHYDDIAKMPETEKIKSEINELEEGFKNASYTLTSGNTTSQNNAKDYEDFWRKSVGDTLYKKFIETYTKKMWMIEDNKIISDFSWSPKGVAIKYGAREGWDSAISAYPTEVDGYNKFFDTAEELCDIYVKSNVEEIRPDSLSVKIEGEWKEYDLIINTAPLDDLFKGIYSPLVYIGRKIEFVILPVEYALPKDVYFAYYTGNEAYTRVVEYKKFSRHKSKNTLISLEYPTKENGKYYPMPTEKDKKQYQKYQKLCHPNMLNAGRIGLYNYRYDIDDVMEQIIEISEGI